MSIISTVIIDLFDGNLNVKVGERISLERKRFIILFICQIKHPTAHFLFFSSVENNACTCILMIIAVNSLIYVIEILIQNEINFTVDCTELVFKKFKIMFDL